MTKQEKLDILEKAISEEVLRWLESSIRWHGAYEAKYGGLDKETLAFAEDVELCRTELLKRLEKAEG